MDVLAEFSSSIVAAAAVLIVAWLGKERYDARFAAVDARFDAIDGRLNRVEEDVRELRGEIRELRGEVGGEIGALRSDLTQIALAVGARLRPDAS